MDAVANGVTLTFLADLGTNLSAINDHGHVIGSASAVYSFELIRPIYGDDDVPVDEAVSTKKEEEMSVQTGWRWCHKCSGLFYAGNPGEQGVCPADHHAHDVGQSGHYSIADEQSIFGASQTGWRWCHKCSGLFYAGNPGAQGVCPADRHAHDANPSSNYVALLNDGMIRIGLISVPFGQPGWRWCRKCQGMFYAGDPGQQGVCPADQHTHDPGPSSHYGILWDFPKPTSRQLDSGWLASGLPLGGSVQVVMQENGDFDFKSHAHDSGFDNIDYTVSAVLMTPDAYAFTFQHSGHVEGTVAGLPFGTPNRDDNFEAPAANNSVINTHWDGILQGTFAARIDGTDTLVQGIEGVLGDLVKSLVQQLGEAAAKGIIALLTG